MSIHITKNGIRARGRDANSLFIAMMPDDSLLEAFKNRTGSEEFQAMVKEAITARGLEVPSTINSEPSTNL